MEAIINNNISIDILKIIQKSKLIILEAFESDEPPKSNKHFTLNNPLSEIDSLLNDTMRSIEREAKIFSRNYPDETMMINTINASLDRINEPIKKSANIFTYIKHSDKYYDLEQVLLLKLFEKLLNSYLQWLSKLEMAVMGLNDGDVMFSLNFDDEIKLIYFYMENVSTEEESDCLLPVLVAFGLGSILG